MTDLFYLILPVLGGIAFSIQSPTNAHLSTKVGYLKATAISFTCGTLVLGLLSYFIGSGDLTRIPEASPWQLLGGLYGAVFVVVVNYVTPILGVALAMTIISLGELLMGVVIDRFGLFGTEQVTIGPLRLLGILVVFIGILLIHKGMKKGAKKSARSKKFLLCAALSLLGGIGTTVQSPTNAALATHVGQVEASFVSFLTGCLIAWFLTLVTKKSKSHSKKSKDLQPWMLIGGLYGAIGVTTSILSIPHLGSALLIAAMMLGQLLGGLVIDSFGWFRTKKIPLNTWRVTGILTILAGVLIVSAAKGAF